MSKIHQAIRKAEKEGRSIASHRIEGGKRQNAIEYLVKEISKLPSIGSSSQEALQSKLKTLPALEPESEQVVDLRIHPGSGIVAVANPRSFAGLQYRVLKKKLSSFKQAKHLTTLLITSVSSSEGKTLTAINLALTIAQEIDQRVLLVDSNLKRPSVHSVLGLSAEKGLVNALRGESSIVDVMLRTRISNFAVVPSGSKSEDSRELLNGEKMKDILAASAELFDWVILDSPALVPFEDVEGLSSLVDGILVVVGARQTRQSVVSRIQPLKGKKLLGFVLNGIHSQEELDVDL